MNLKLVTAVTTEPITKAEVKSHLRLDSTTFIDEISETQSILPGSHVSAASYSLQGTGVDVLGYPTIVVFNAGTCGAGGTVDVKIQESDNDSTYTDWTGGGFTQVTTANDNAIYEKEYTGTKRYIRVVVTVGTETCEFSVTVVKDTPTTVEDTQIDAWITVAREYGEAVTGCAFAPATYDYFLDDFPAEDTIEWPLTPLTSVTEVYYTDSDADETKMTATTDYLVDDDTYPGGIFLPYGSVWPSFTPYPYNAVRIRGVCGYTGTAPYIIPKNFKQAMLVHVGLMYKYRDQGIPAEDLRTVLDLYRLDRDPRRWF